MTPAKPETQYFDRCQRDTRSGRNHTLNGLDRMCLLAILSLVGCSPETKNIVATTQITLHLESDDERLQERAEELRVSLWIQRAGKWTKRAQGNVSGAALRWPLDLPTIATKAEDLSAQIELVVKAFQGDQQIAETRLLTAFVSGKRWTVSTTIELCPSPPPPCSDDSCHGAECTFCAGDGSCTPVRVLPAEDGTGEPEDAKVGAAGSEGEMQEPVMDAGIRDAARESGTSNTTDAPLMIDSGIAEGGTMPNLCPPDHGCEDPYPCVPTTLGYTCLGQFADWPMPDAVPGAKAAPSYTLGSSGETVLDNITGLEWQLNRLGEVDGDEAKAYCEDLAHGLQDDWRLPSVIELVSLLDTSRLARERIYFDDGGSNFSTIFFPGIDTMYFTDVDGCIDHMTNSATDYTSLDHEERLFRSLDYCSRITDLVAWAPVRCVRGGREPPFPRPDDRYIVDEVGDTVHDRATGLIWQRTVRLTTVEQANVEATCAQSGFRVPTVNELMTLVDLTRSRPTIDTSAFPNTPATGTFWAATRPDEPTGVRFEEGDLVHSAYFETASANFLRCVRNAE